MDIIDQELTLTVYLVMSSSVRLSRVDTEQAEWPVLTTSPSVAIIVFLNYSEKH